MHIYKINAGQITWDSNYYKILLNYYIKQQNIGNTFVEVLIISQVTQLIYSLGVQRVCRDIPRGTEHNI